jgi:filamentous hemagglutinin
MAIGRISGSVLKSNLTRNGVDLAFETNLLYLDVTNSRVGIGTSEPTTALHVNGTITTSGLAGLTTLAVDGVTITDNTVKSNASNSNLELGANGTGKVSISGLLFPTSDGSADQFLKTDGSGTLSFATVSTNSISQGDSNVTVTDSGTGAITIAADGNTIITMNATTVLDASATTNAVRLPNGTTAQRPSGSVGMIRYNSSTDTIEGYTTAGGWAQLGATSSTAENTDDTATATSTAISTVEKVINQFTVGTYDSAWYLAVTRDEINDEVSTAKYSLVHNDSSAFVATSHITESDPTNGYITVDADVTGGNARLKATGSSVVNSVSMYRIGLGDNTTAGTTGNITTVINTDVDSASEVLDSFAHASYRGAKYYISVNNATKTEVSNIEAIVVHDGTTAYITTYGNVNTGSNDLVSLTAAINGANVELSVAGNEPDLRVTSYRILLSDSESASTGDNVNIVGATTVSSTATTVDSFSNSTYTGAFYVFTGYNATEGAASVSEVTVVSNDDVYISAGPILSTKGTDQLQFTATQSGSSVTVKAASTSGASTTVNGYRVHMLRGSAGASTADTVLVSTDQTITGAKTFTSPIALTVGSDPTTVADKAHIYAKDEASSAEVFVRDEAGNVTKISPHNQAGEWEYYSRNVKTGKTVRINMEEMIRDIENLTGKTYIKND